MTPFLIAQVPYGQQGFTLLLGQVTYAHRHVAESALDAVSGRDARAEETCIYVRRSASQRDTGRDGMVCLVLANVAVSQLDPDSQERLQWKLSVLVDNLGEVMAASQSQAPQYGAYLESPLLRAWEMDLQVDQLPSAGRGPQSPVFIPRGRSRPPWKHWPRWLLIATLVLPCVLVWKFSGGRVVHETTDRTVKTRSTISSHSDALVLKQERSAPLRQSPSPKPWSAVITDWKTADANPDSSTKTGRNVAKMQRAIKRMAMELKNRSATPIDESDKRLLNDYLSGVFESKGVASSKTVSQQKTDADLPSIQPQLVEILKRLKQLMEIDVVSLGTVAENLGNEPFEQAVTGCLTELIQSQIVKNAKRLCSGDVTRVGVLAKPEIAVRPVSSLPGGPGPVAAEDMLRSQVTENWTLPAQLSQIGEQLLTLSIGRDLSPDGQNLLKKTQAVLSTLSETAKVHIEVRVEMLDFKDRSINRGNIQETGLLQLLHRESLVVTVDDQHAWSMSNCREYIRPLLLSRASQIPKIKTANFKPGKKPGSPAEMLRLTVDVNAVKFDEWKKLQQKLASSIAEVEALAPGVAADKDMILNAVECR